MQESKLIFYMAEIPAALSFKAPVQAPPSFDEKKHISSSDHTVHKLVNNQIFCGCWTSTNPNSNHQN